jgi:hypothetical protein
MVMAGGIAAAVVITMVGVEVVAITTAGRAVGIAVGIKPYTQRGRLSWWPLSFPAPPSAIAPERPRFDALPGSKLPKESRSRGYIVTEIGEGEWILSAAIFTGA